MQSSSHDAKLRNDAQEDMVINCVKGCRISTDDQVTALVALRVSITVMRAGSVKCPGLTPD